MEATESSADRTTGQPSEIEGLKEELRREHEMYMRSLADFDNYRRRVERESASAARSGKRAIILSLLDVLDGFDRALEHIGEEPSSVSEGLRAIHRKLLNLLEGQGVTPFSSVGQIFDPEKHEAIGSVDSDDYKPGVVAEEVGRGYVWDHQVLRPARVRVAK